MTETLKKEIRVEGPEKYYRTEEIKIEGRTDDWEENKWDGKEEGITNTWEKRREGKERK
jgi:hypothetical protein